MQTILSLLILFLAIAYVEYRMKSVRRDSAEDRTDAKDYFATKEEVKNALRKITEQMTEFHTATEERMASLEEKAFFTPQVEETATTPSTAGQEEDPDPSVVYFRWPADDGSFTDSQRLTVQTEDTYYLFRLDDSRTHAEFTFVTMSDTQLSKANNSSKKYIERACSFSGAKSGRYVCTPGRAHLERGRWLIDQKARIEYQ